jgi:predicted secreted hydrolase
MRSFSISCLFLLLMSTAAWGQEEFRPIVGPCDFTFPRDHGAHEGHRVEWWYYTGNVENSLRERYGFQLTFFRTELIPPGRDKDWPPRPSAWRTRELFSAHAALSDPGERRFLYDQKVVRGAAGLAGVEVADESTKIFLDDWSSQ